MNRHFFNYNVIKYLRALLQNTHNMKTGLLYFNLFINYHHHLISCCGPIDRHLYAPDLGSKLTFSGFIIVMITLPSLALKHH